MATGLEALGAASAVLQVVSFASDLVVACKNAYDGATTPQDDLERHAEQMFEAVSRVYTRCDQMNNANSKFANPKLQNIAQDCKDAADRLRAEVQYVTSIQAQGNILKSVRKALRTSKHQRKLQSLEASFSRYQQLIKIELTSHLWRVYCSVPWQISNAYYSSQSNAIYLQQQQSFQKLDSDIQLLVNQITQGAIDVLDLVKKEQATTRAAFTLESGRAERAINTHIDTRVLDLRTTTETNQQCRIFLQSLKGERMNQRYSDVMDSTDATFNQVFATYEEMIYFYYQDSEGEDGPEYHHDMWSLWYSFVSWLQSEEILFYIEGKPGSGKSTLIKFILDHGRTLDLVQKWNPDTIIVRYFFWKIGSHEQNSIKGLWSSLL